LFSIPGFNYVNTRGKLTNLNIIRIYDVKGNMVLQNNLVGILENYEIQVGEFAPGVYIVKSRNGKQLGTGMFIKE